MPRWNIALLVLAVATGGFAPNPVAMAADACMDQCSGTEADIDGDGLDACVESCLGTSDENVDSDGDGMPDNFEFVHSLEPLVNDAGNNPDGDDLTNLEEFLQSSDPLDRTSPYAAVYIAPNGDDRHGLGTRDHPWRTVGFALTQLSPSHYNMECITLLEGVYEENITLIPWVSLIGERGSHVTVTGRIEGASNARLKNLTLTPALGQEYLLDLNNVAMRLTAIVFAGSPERDVTGVLMDGDTAGESVFDSCTFTGLGVGIDVGGAVPTVRRSTFGDIPAQFGDPARPGAGIIIREGVEQGAVTKAIGDEADPGDGWNDFLRSIEGFAVINERDEAVPMQANYWGTIDPAEFPTRVSGSAVVLPVLVQSSAVLASSIFCTVWDAADQKRIDSASINLTISAFNEVTENRDGTYAFPAVSEGEYTIIVNADGYAPSQMNVALDGGEIKSVAMAMTPEAPAGNGSADDFAKGCALRDGTPAGGEQRAGGDLVLLGVVLAAMLTRLRGRSA